MQQRLTRKACHKAGFETVHFITERTAAVHACTYGFQSFIQPGKTNICLIFDLGGGTLDITIFKLTSQKRVEILASGGDPRLGGEDFNDLLTEYCIDEFKRMHSIDLAAGKNSEHAAVRTKTARILRKIRTDCETKKIHLSYINTVKIYVDEVTRELDLVIPVTRKIFEDLIDGHLKRCIVTMDNILKRSGIAKELIDNVVLFGGSSRIPKVQQMVSEFFGGKELLKNINADEAVACGAAVYAFNAFDKRAADKTFTVIDTTAHIESYSSTTVIQVQQLIAAATIITNSIEGTDQSEESLFKDLQNLKEILLKHMMVFSTSPEEVCSWFQNFKIFEDDILNESQATPLERQRIISALLDTQLLPELANILCEIYEKNDALKLNETILKRRISLLGPDHLETIEAQFQVARCLDDLNVDYNTLEATNALDLYETVLEKRKQILEESHKDTLIVEYWIGTVLENQKKYEDALNLAEKVHQMQCSTLGRDHIEALQTHVWMAYCLLQMKDQTKAIELGLHLYQKLKLLTNDNSRIVVKSKYAVACVLALTNKFNEALSLFEDIYQAWVSKLGEDHLQTITTQDYTAFCFNGLGEYNKALEIYTSVFNKRKEFLGPNHRNTLATAHNTAWALQKKRHFNEALDLFEDVYQRCVSTLGENSALTLNTREQIAFCLIALQKYSKALKIYTNVLNKRKEILRPNHRDTLAVESNIGFILKMQNKFKEALNFFDEIYQGRVLTLGEDNEDTVETREQIAFCLNKLKEHKKALEIYTSVFHKRIEVLGPNHRDTLRIEHEIACTLYSQGKHKEAQDLFQQVYEKKVTHLRKDDPDTLATLEWLEN